MSLIETVKLKLNQPVNMLNYRILSFSGTADGTKLTRHYSNTVIQQSYLRIISVLINYYSDNSVWMRECAEDNKIFTANINSKYSMLQPYTKLEPKFLEKFVSTNKLNLYIDSNKMNIFPDSSIGSIEKIDLNVISNSKVMDGLDISLLTTFYSDMELGTLTNPFVNALIQVEIINDIKAITYSHQDISAGAKNV
jgi:hypothetical protein